MLYPTEPGEPRWIEEMRDEWIDSGCRYFSFSFLDFHPGTLDAQPFWMYMYFTENSTQNATLQRVIKFRIMVLEHSSIGYGSRKDVFQYSFTSGTPKVWFLCSQLDEIRKVDTSFLTDSDFDHLEGKKLLSAIRNSIAPVRRLSPINIFQKTVSEIQD